MASSQYGVWFPNNGSGGSFAKSARLLFLMGSYIYDMPSQVSVNKRLDAYRGTQQSITTNVGTYPVTSGVVTTYGKMEFDGGYLQISSEGARGRWLMALSLDVAGQKRGQCQRQF